jgi:ribosomal protein S26
MSDTILKDDEGQTYSYDNIKTQGWVDGHVAGAQCVAAFLREKAVAAFSAKKDVEAKLFRELADEVIAAVVPDLQRKAEQHMKRHPERLWNE